MKTIFVKAKLLEAMLGTSPADKEIYSSYIGSNAPDAQTLAEEIEALGADNVAEKGMTVFPRTADGIPFIYDYQIKGFFKDACKMLSKLSKEKDARGKKKPVNESSKLRAYKQDIDGLIFVSPREIPIIFDGDVTVCQRPLRASTPQGERVALASSEEIPAGAELEFEITCLDDDHVAAVLEWLDYGRLRGLGQWRNSGKGRFSYEITEEM